MGRGTSVPTALDNSQVPLQAPLTAVFNKAKNLLTPPQKTQDPLVEAINNKDTNQSGLLTNPNDPNQYRTSALEDATLFNSILHGDILDKMSGLAGTAIRLLPKEKQFMNPVLGLQMGKQGMLDRQADIENERLYEQLSVSGSTPTVYPSTTIQTPQYKTGPSGKALQNQFEQLIDASEMFQYDAKTNRLKIDDTKRDNVLNKVDSLLDVKLKMMKDSQDPTYMALTGRSASNLPNGWSDPNEEWSIAANFIMDRFRGVANLLGIHLSDPETEKIVDDWADARDKVINASNAARYMKENNIDQSFSPHYSWKDAVGQVGSSFANGFAIPFNTIFFGNHPEGKNIMNISRGNDYVSPYYRDNMVELIAKKIGIKNDADYNKLMDKNGIVDNALIPALTSVAEMVGSFVAPWGSFRIGSKIGMESYNLLKLKSLDLLENTSAKLGITEASWLTKTLKTNAADKFEKIVKSLGGLTQEPIFIANAVKLEHPVVGDALKWIVGGEKGAGIGQTLITTSGRMLKPLADYGGSVFLNSHVLATGMTMSALLEKNPHLTWDQLFETYMSGALMGAFTHIPANIFANGYRNLAASSEILQKMYPEGLLKDKILNVQKVATAISSIFAIPGSGLVSTYMRGQTPEMNQIIKDFGTGLLFTLGSAREVRNEVGKTEKKAQQKVDYLQKNRVTEEIPPNEPTHVEDIGDARMTVPSEPIKLIRNKTAVEVLHDKVGKQQNEPVTIGDIRDKLVSDTDIEKSVAKTMKGASKEQIQAGVKIVKEHLDSHREDVVGEHTGDPEDPHFMEYNDGKISILNDKIDLGSDFGGVNSFYEDFTNNTSDYLVRGFLHEILHDKTVSIYDMNPEKNREYFSGIRRDILKNLTPESIEYMNSDRNTAAEAKALGINPWQTSDLPDEDTMNKELIAAMFTGSEKLKSILKETLIKSGDRSSNIYDFTASKIKGLFGKAQKNSAFIKGIEGVLNFIPEELQPEVNQPEVPNTNPEVMAGQPSVEKPVIENPIVEKPIVNEPITGNEELDPFIQQVKQSETIKPEGVIEDTNSDTYAMSIRQLKSNEFKEKFGDWENDPENASKMTTKYFNKPNEERERERDDNGLYYNTEQNRYYLEEEYSNISDMLPEEVTMEDYVKGNMSNEPPPEPDIPINTNEPIPFYRGTQTVDEGTKDNPLRVQRGHRAAGENLVGIYLTNDPKYAEGYTHSDRDFLNKNKPKAPNIIPVYLNIKNPIIVTSTSDGTAYETGVTNEKDINNNEIPLVLDNKGNVAEQPNYPSYFTQEHLDYYKNLGYDGVVYNKGKEVIAFDPSQIIPAYQNPERLKDLAPGVLGMSINSLKGVGIESNLEDFDKLDSKVRDLNTILASKGYKADVTIPQIYDELNRQGYTNPDVYDILDKTNTLIATAKEQEKLGKGIVQQDLERLGPARIKETDMKDFLSGIENGDETKTHDNIEKSLYKVQNLHRYLGFTSSSQMKKELLGKSEPEVRDLLYTNLKNIYESGNRNYSEEQLNNDVNRRLVMVLNQKLAKNLSISFLPETQGIKINELGSNKWGTTSDYFGKSEFLSSWMGDFYINHLKKYNFSPGTKSIIQELFIDPEFRYITDVEDKNKFDYSIENDRKLTKEQLQDPNKMDLLNRLGYYVFPKVSGGRTLFSPSLKSLGETLNTMEGESKTNAIKSFVDDINGFIMHYMSGSQAAWEYSKRNPEGYQTWLPYLDMNYPDANNRNFSFSLKPEFAGEKELVKKLGESQVVEELTDLANRIFLKYNPITGESTYTNPYNNTSIRNSIAELFRYSVDGSGLTNTYKEQTREMIDGYKNVGKYASFVSNPELMRLLKLNHVKYFDPNMIQDGKVNEEYLKGLHMKFDGKNIKRRRAVISDEFFKVANGATPEHERLFSKINSDSWGFYLNRKLYEFDCKVLGATPDIHKALKIALYNYNNGNVRMVKGLFGYIPEGEGNDFLHGLLDSWGRYAGSVTFNSAIKNGDSYKANEFDYLDTGLKIGITEKGDIAYLYDPNTKKMFTKGTDEYKEAFATTQQQVLQGIIPEYLIQEDNLTGQYAANYLTYAKGTNVSSDGSGAFQVHNVFGNLFDSYWEGDENAKMSIPQILENKRKYGTGIVKDHLTFWNAFNNFDAEAEGNWLLSSEQRNSMGRVLKQMQNKINNTDENNENYYSFISVLGKKRINSIMDKMLNEDGSFNGNKEAMEAFISLNSQVVNSGTYNGPGANTLVLYGIKDAIDDAIKVRTTGLMTNIMPSYNTIKDTQRLIDTQVALKAEDWKNLASETDRQKLIADYRDRLTKKNQFTVFNQFDENGNPISDRHNMIWLSKKEYIALRERYNKLGDDYDLGVGSHLLVARIPADSMKSMNAVILAGIIDGEGTCSVAPKLNELMGTDFDKDLLSIKIPDRTITPGLHETLWQHMNNSGQAQGAYSNVSEELKDIEKNKHELRSNRFILNPPKGLWEETVQKDGSQGNTVGLRNTLTQLYTSIAPDKWKDNDQYWNKDWGGKYFTKPISIRTGYEEATDKPIYKTFWFNFRLPDAWHTSKEGKTYHGASNFVNKMIEHGVDQYDYKNIDETQTLLNYLIPQVQDGESKQRMSYKEWQAAYAPVDGYRQFNSKIRKSAGMNIDDLKNIQSLFMDDKLAKMTDTDRYNHYNQFANSLKDISIEVPSGERESQLVDARQFNPIMRAKRGQAKIALNMNSYNKEYKAILDAYGITYEQVDAIKDAVTSILTSKLSEEEGIAYDHNPLSEIVYKRYGKNTDRVKETIYNTIMNDAFNRFPGKITGKAIDRNPQWRVGATKDEITRLRYDIDSGKKKPDGKAITINKVDVPLKELFSPDGRLTNTNIPINVLNSEVLINAIRFNKKYTSRDLNELTAKIVSNIVNRLYPNLDAVEKGKLFTAIGYTGTDTPNKLIKGSPLQLMKSATEGYVNDLSVKWGVDPEVAKKVATNETVFDIMDSLSVAKKNGINPLMSDGNLVEDHLIKVLTTPKDVSLQIDNKLGMHIRSLVKEGTKDLASLLTGNQIKFKDIASKEYYQLLNIPLKDITPEMKKVLDKPIYFYSEADHKLLAPAIAKGVNSFIDELTDSVYSPEEKQVIAKELVNELMPQYTAMIGEHYKNDTSGGDLGAMLAKSAVLMNIGQVLIRMKRSGKYADIDSFIHDVKKNWTNYNIMNSIIMREQYMEATNHLVPFDPKKPWFTVQQSINGSYKDANGALYHNISFGPDDIINYATKLQAGYLLPLHLPMFEMLTKMSEYKDSILYDAFKFAEKNDEDKGHKDIPLSFNRIKNITNMKINPNDLITYYTESAVGNRERVTKLMYKGEPKQYEPNNEFEMEDLAKRILGNNADYTDIQSMKDYLAIKGNINGYANDMQTLKWVMRQFKDSLGDGDLMGRMDHSIHSLQEVITDLTGIAGDKIIHDGLTPQTLAKYTLKMKASPDQVVGLINKIFDINDKESIGGKLAGMSKTKADFNEKYKYFNDELITKTKEEKASNKNVQLFNTILQELSNSKINTGEIPQELIYEQKQRIEESLKAGRDKYLKAADKLDSKVDRNEKDNETLKTLLSKVDTYNKSLQDIGNFSNDMINDAMTYVNMTNTNANAMYNVLRDMGIASFQANWETLSNSQRFEKANLARNIINNKIDGYLNAHSNKIDIALSNQYTGLTESSILKDGTYGLEENKFTRKIADEMRDVTLEHLLYTLDPSIFNSDGGAIDASYKNMFENLQGKLNEVAESITSIAYKKYDLKKDSHQFAQELALNRIFNVLKGNYPTIIKVDKDKITGILKQQPDIVYKYFGDNRTPGKLATILKLNKNGEPIKELGRIMCAVNLPTNLNPDLTEPHLVTYNENTKQYIATPMEDITDILVHDPYRKDLVLKKQEAIYEKYMTMYTDNIGKVLQQNAKVVKGANRSYVWDRKLTGGTEDRPLYETTPYDNPEDAARYKKYANIEIKPEGLLALRDNALHMQEGIDSNMKFKEVARLANSMSGLVAYLGGQHAVNAMAALMAMPVVGPGVAIAAMGISGIKLGSRFVRMWLGNYLVNSSANTTMEMNKKYVGDQSGNKFTYYRKELFGSFQRIARDLIDSFGQTTSQFGKAYASAIVIGESSGEGGAGIGPAEWKDLVDAEKGFNPFSKAYHTFQGLKNYELLHHLNNQLEAVRVLDGTLKEKMEKVKELEDWYQKKYPGSNINILTTLKQDLNIPTKEGEQTTTDTKLNIIPISKGMSEKNLDDMIFNLSRLKAGMLATGGWLPTRLLTLSSIGMNTAANVLSMNRFLQGFEGKSTEGAFAKAQNNISHIGKNEQAAFDYLVSPENPHRELFKDLMLNPHGMDAYAEYELTKILAWQSIGNYVKNPAQKTLIGGMATRFSNFGRENFRNQTVMQATRNELWTALKSELGADRYDALMHGMGYTGIPLGSYVLARPNVAKELRGAYMYPLMRGANKLLAYSIGMLGLGAGLNKVMNALTSSYDSNILEAFTITWAAQTAFVQLIDSFMEPFLPPSGIKTTDEAAHNRSMKNIVSAFRGMPYGYELGTITGLPFLLGYWELENALGRPITGKDKQNFSNIALESANTISNNLLGLGLFNPIKKLVEKNSGSQAVKGWGEKSGNWNKKKSSW